MRSAHCVCVCVCVRARARAHVHVGGGEACAFNPLKMKQRLLYLKTQSIPRCKHFSSQL